MPCVVFKFCGAPHMVRRPLAARRLIAALDGASGSSNDYEGRNIDGTHVS